MSKLRVDVRPYFPKIANYYWDHMDPATDGSIWNWLQRDYNIIKIGSIGTSKALWVTFPDEQQKVMFYLRWA